MKILSIIGARPQFIKEAIIQSEINKHSDIEEVVVHTGQHYDENMSGVFFEVLNMRTPDYNLGISSSKHGEMTALMMIDIENILLKEKPDLVLLYGDTNSTLAGGLVASKLKIPKAHIEAGLRQNPKDMPEEINRQVTDRISEYLFSPSLLGVENLRKEGLTENVYFVGDVMYDVYKMMEPKFDYSLVKKLNLVPNEYFVMTLHRDFNVDNRESLEKILVQVNNLSKIKKVVFPIHPRTKKRIDDYNLSNLLNEIVVLQPLNYLELMGLTQNAFKIITDSGGYQKEAYFAGKEACIIMPDTGWIELVNNGLNKLVSYNDIYEKALAPNNYKFIHNIYGDGKSAEKIIEILIDIFKK